MALHSELSVAETTLKSRPSVGEVRAREKWSRNVEFVLSAIGFAVGLGNIWRFPYLCYKNGGGAFLIPYFVCLVAGGVPIFFLEVGIGQLTSEGGITAWNICPIFKGIGYGTTIICFLLNIYYIVIMAWAMHFFYSSFTTQLPWASCDNWWNTPSCFSPGHHTGSAAIATNGTSRVDSVVEYWERKVLGLSKGIDEPEGLQWELVASLAVVWIIVYFCVWKGIKSSGKVVYLTATFPYVMLTVLLIRGATLPGALDGIIFYLKPDFHKLAEAQVWIDAGTQIFFSYAIALGCMTALGSYNHYNNNFVNDCIFIASTNSLTSLYSGFAIFSVLGFMAQEQGLPIDKVAEKGPGLVFIAYPKAVMHMPLAPVWAVCFFFMIILMGLDSQFVGVEGFITAIVDLFPSFLRVGRRREWFIATVSAVSFCIGLTMVTRASVHIPLLELLVICCISLHYRVNNTSLPTNGYDYLSMMFLSPLSILMFNQLANSVQSETGGMYVFQVFDYYAASGMVLLWFCFFESIAVAYGYGVERFYDDIKDMIGYRLGPWFRICWLFLTPIVTMGILVFSVLSTGPLVYNVTYVYPSWAMTIGWSMAIVSMVMIPAYFVIHLVTRAGSSWKEKWLIATTSTFQRPTSA